MAQLKAVDGLTTCSVVGARAGAISHLPANRETAAIDCYGRRITFPAHSREAVRFTLTHSRFAVRDMAGGLDDAGKLAVVRRLVREGLVMVFSRTLG